MHKAKPNSTRPQRSPTTPQQHRNDNTNKETSGFSMNINFEEDAVPILSQLSSSLPATATVPEQHPSRKQNHNHQHVMQQPKYDIQHPSYTSYFDNGGTLNNNYSTMGVDGSGNYVSLTGGNGVNENYDSLEGGDSINGNYASLEGGDTKIGNYVSLEGGDSINGNYASLEGGDSINGNYSSLNGGADNWGESYSLNGMKGSVYKFYFSLLFTMFVFQRL